jgi:flagellar motor switch protein FliG
MSQNKNKVDRMIESMSEREIEETIEVIKNSKNISYNHIEQLADEYVSSKEEEENSQKKGWWR